jgi:integrase
LARKRYQRGALRREGNLWVLRWREDVLDKVGTIVRVERRARVGSTKDLPTKALARRVADGMIDHVNAPDYRPGRIATVAEFSEIYKSQIAPTLKPSSCESDKSICRIYLEPILGQYRLDQLGGSAPQVVITELMSRGLSRKTMKNALSTLAAMLNAARDWNYTASKVDWGKLRLPTEEVEIEQRHFTPEEAQRIINAAPEPWNICFAFMAYLGLRTGETVGIAWQHVDIDSAVLMVRQSNWRGRFLTVKSKASRRDLPIPLVLVDMLRNYQPHWIPNAHGLLFANHKGQPITACYVRRDILHPIRERLEIPRGGFHAFRHGNATAMFSEGGASPKVVQDQLGHAHIQTTMRYTHSVSEDHRRAVERMTDAFVKRGSTPPLAPPFALQSRRFAANGGAKLLRVK